MTSLAALQAWMQDRVIAGAWAQPTDDPDCHAHVVGSAVLPAEARLAIYARSYVARLAECLRTEFPLLRALIGDQVFNLFVGGYLSAHPPASPSLYALGAGFPDYLEATRPQPHSGPGTPEALPASLARLERAIAESERAAGLEEAARPGLPLDPFALLHDQAARLAVPPSLRLLRLDFDFSATLAGAPEGGRPALPAPCDSPVAVARSFYRVRVHALAPWQFAWLSALAANGGAVHAATATAAQAAGDHGAQLANLLVWLPVAAACGFVGPAG